MRFPAPDVGVARFPRPDSRTVSFPGPDVATVRFPPAPIKTVFGVSESTLDFTSTVVPRLSVAVQTSSTLDFVAETIRVIDDVKTASALDFSSTSTVKPVAAVASQSVLDITSVATQKPVMTVATSTALDLTSTAVTKPVVTVASQSTLDISSTVAVLPAVPLAGTTVLDMSSSATQNPIAVVATQSTLDITSEGVLRPFIAPYVVAISEGGTSGSGTAITSASVPLPSYLPGDLLIAFAALGSGSSYSMSSPDSRWNQVVNGPNGGTSGAGVAVFVQQVNSSIGGTATFTQSTAGKWGMTIVSVRGSGLAVGPSNYTVNTSSATSQTAPSLSVAVDNALVLRIASVAATSESLSVDWSNGTTLNTHGSGTIGTFGMTISINSIQQATAGVTPNGPFSWSGSRRSGAASIAIYAT